MPGKAAMGSLTYNDKKAMLAAAIGLNEWRIDDISDTHVFYTADEESSPGSRFRGAFMRPYTIAEGNKITLGDAIRGIVRRTFEPITVVGMFSLEPETAEFSDTGMVTLKGKVFEAGEYPDKNFSITEEQLATAAAEFKPVENDLDHHQSILTGKQAFGTLKSVEVKGKELFGTVEVPKWLYDKAGNAMKVSLAWLNGAKKQIVGNALVMSPRIPDAEVVAAFTAAEEAARTDNAANTNGGAEMPQKKPSWWDKFVAFCKSGELPEGLKDANPDDVTFAEDPGKAETPPVPATPPNTQAAQVDPAEFSRQQTELAGLRASQLGTAAERFYADALQARKAFPAEKDSLIALFKQAAQDDNQGSACFSAEGVLQEGTRVKALREMIEKRPTHNFTSEQLSGLKAEDLVVLSTGSPQGGQMTEERRTELLNAGDIKVQEAGK